MTEYSNKIPNNPRILLVNDDGINAPGLESLIQIAEAISDDVWVVAPEWEQSGAGHSLSLSEPLRLRELAPQRFAVKGTPTDCVLMACSHLLADKAPDLVLSGVNKGANMADDVTYSGTIAGAMQGMVHGVPSIALSQAYGLDGNPDVSWEMADAWGAPVVRNLIEYNNNGLWPENVVMNVNFPAGDPAAMKGVQVTRQGKRDKNTLHVDERADARGHAYYWVTFDRVLSTPAPGTDLHAIYNQYISVTPLHRNLTETQTLPTLDENLQKNLQA